VPRETRDAPVRWMECHTAFVWVQGARPVKYRTAYVRDRHTGRIAEVPLTEYPPEDEGSHGVTRVVAKGERLPSDDPAVLAKPGYFREAPDLVLAERK
jgi:hypothetical protein